MRGHVGEVLAGEHGAPTGGRNVTGRCAILTDALGEKTALKDGFRPIELEYPEGVLPDGFPAEPNCFRGVPWRYHRPAPTRMDIGTVTVVDGAKPAISWGLK